MTPMENRILESILRVIERSGVKIEDVPAKHQEWGVNMREKIKEIGWDGMYVPTGSVRMRSTGHGWMS
jgi:hypothetical protein